MTLKFNTTHLYPRTPYTNAMFVATMKGHFTTEHERMLHQPSYQPAPLKAFLTKLHPHVIPFADVLQVARDEVIQPPHEIALLVRPVAFTVSAVGSISALRSLSFDADAQRVLEEQFGDDRIVAHVESALRVTSDALPRTEKAMGEGAPTMIHWFHSSWRVASCGPTNRRMSHAQGYTSDFCPPPSIDLFGVPQTQGHQECVTG